MKVVLTINGIPRNVRVKNIESLYTWFNSNKCYTVIEDSYIELLDVLLDRCLKDVKNVEPLKRNITVEVIGRQRITRVCETYNSKVIMQLFKPDLNVITDEFVKDLRQIKELTSVAVSSHKAGNSVNVKVVK